MKKKTKESKKEKKRNKENKKQRKKRIKIQKVKRIKEHVERIEIQRAKIGQGVGWNGNWTMAPQRTKELNKVERNKQSKVTMKDSKNWEELFQQGKELEPWMKRKEKRNSTQLS